MLDKRLMRRGPVVGAFLALWLAAVVAGGVRADAPLTTADVVRFLSAGISEGTILEELKRRGFGEALDPDLEAAVREAGGTETLVVAVRRAAAARERTVSSSPVSPPGAPTTVAAAATFAARSGIVRVPVAVVDKAGGPVLGLRIGDFRISDAGRRQPVTLFSPERRALRLAIALDLSRSMRNKIAEVEAALRHFIGVLEPVDEVLVITFSDHVQVVQDFTSDREVLSRVLDMLEPGGGTALYDAAYEAIQRVAPGPAESKAVVLVTDGVDTSSLTSFEALRELARRSEVPVFSIGLDVPDTAEHQVARTHRGFPGMGGGRRGPGGGGGRGGFGGGGGGWRGGAHKDFDAGPLKDLADETGALAEIVKDLGHFSAGSDERRGDHLKAAVESIAMTLRHRYLLGYDAPGGKPGWRTIDIEVDRPAVKPRARKGYYAAG